MNVYDFDNTIYRGDSSIDFWLFCLKHRPGIVLLLPYQFWMAFLYKLKIVEKVKFKEAFFSFLKRLPDAEKSVCIFWDKNQNKIKEWYVKQQKEDDLVISASPLFLLEEICKRVGIKRLIATDVDIKSGSFRSPNCYGEEKVKRFRLEYPDENVNGFYSDSLSDRNMAEIAQNAFIVKGDNINPWKWE